MTVVVVLLSLVVLRWIMVFVAAFVLVTPVDRCPACFHDTVPVRKWWLWLLGPWIEWRWCPSCRWQGPSRIGESELAAPPGMPDSR